MPEKGETSFPTTRHLKANVDANRRVLPNRKGMMAP